MNNKTTQLKLDRQIQLPWAEEMEEMKNEAICLLLTELGQGPNPRTQRLEI